MSDLEDALFLQLKIAGVELPEREVRWHESRRWRADFLWREQGVMVEVEGGIWKGNKGRHTSPSGFQGDVEKYNAATLAGWRLYRVTREMIESGEALTLIERALQGEGNA